MFTFDAMGQGKSEGDYISLGQEEAYDLGIIVDHIVEEKKASKIILWGESMGAATVIHYMG